MILHRSMCSRSALGLLSFALALAAPALGEAGKMNDPSTYFSTIHELEGGRVDRLQTLLVTIGEESGALDDMLAKVADFYEEEVDNAVDALSSLLEPLIMAILGVLVGGLVVAMYLPIFKLGAVV